MNLINAQVMHRVFGTGSVISVEGDQITVEFTEKFGQKKFCYPSAFEQFLTMCDDTAQEFVSGELKILLNQISDDRVRKEQEFLEEMQRQTDEKKEARKIAAKTKAAETKKIKAAATTKSKTAKTVKVAKA